MAANQRSRKSSQSSYAGKAAGGKTTSDVNMESIKYVSGVLETLIKSGFLNNTGEEQTIIVANILSEIELTVVPFRVEINDINDKVELLTKQLAEIEVCEKEGKTTEIKESKHELLRLINTYEAKAKNINNTKIIPNIDRGRWIMRYLIGLRISAPINMMFQKNWPINLTKVKETKFLTTLSDDDKVLYKASRIVYEFFKKGGEIGTFSYPGYALFSFYIKGKPYTVNLRNIVKNGGYIPTQDMLIDTIKSLQEYGYHCMWRYKAKDGSVDENMYEMAAVAYEQKYLTSKEYHMVLSELNKPPRRIKENIVNNMISKITSTTAVNFGTTVAFISMQPDGYEIIADKLISQCVSLPVTTIDPKTGRVDVTTGYITNLKSAVMAGPDRSCVAMTKTFFAKNSYNSTIAWSGISKAILAKAKDYDKYYNKGSAGALIGELAKDNISDYMTWIETMVNELNSENIVKNAAIVLTSIIHAEIYSAGMSTKLNEIMANTRGKIKYDLLNCIDQFKKFTLMEKVTSADTSITEEKKILSVNDISFDEINSVDSKVFVKQPSLRKKKTNKKENSVACVLKEPANLFSLLENDA